jgi:hypothetical protein
MPPVALIMKEPEYIRQTKANGCWYACLKMLLQWHAGSRTISDPAVKSKVSHFKPRSYTSIDVTFVHTNHLYVYPQRFFKDLNDIEGFLRRNGPFMGGGAVGKVFGTFGPRSFGHAILIYGVTPTGSVLHHDPMAGPHMTISFPSFLKEQDGEVIVRTLNPRIQEAAMGSSL